MPGKALVQIGRFAEVASSERPPLSDVQAQVYRDAGGRVGLEAIHWLIARHGPGILDRGLPYVVVAARHEAAGIARRAATRREVPAGDLPEPPSLWDPLARIEEDDELREVLSALSELDDRDMVVIW